MAITKTHPIKSTLKDAIEYICDSNKTDGHLLISSYGCCAETADIEFAWTREQAIDKGTNLGRHLIQAFEPGEVTPQEAHRIGEELAKEILKGQYEYVLTTHIDKGHIHNHLIFNAVNFTNHRCYHSNKHSYHEIRRISDKICKEHGLSVIVPSKSKGKTYIEHATERTGTSYKAKLKQTIDRLIPLSSNLEDLIRRLKASGYEIKRGKYISCRASDQERFTRIKTLGTDYSEQAIIKRLSGQIRTNRKIRTDNKKIGLLIGIQNSIKAQESAGYSHWAKINNLKQAAKTMNFLKEHNIDSIEELDSKIEELNIKSESILAEIKQSESKLSELSLLMKYSVTYRKLRPVYEAYKKSPDKEKYLRGHESDIILFETADRELRLLKETRKISIIEANQKYATITKSKTALLLKYREMRNKIHEYNKVLVNTHQVLNIHYEYDIKNEHEKSKQHRNSKLLP